MKKKNAINLVLYRRILFTGKNLAPFSSSCSLPFLYILMQKCRYIVCKWLTLIAFFKKKVLPKLPDALYLALSLAVVHRQCIFQSETNSHSRIVNRRQLQTFSMPNISWASATHRQFPQIASLIIYTARWTSTNLPPISGICQPFIKTCRRVKNQDKIVQWELSIRPGVTGL